LNQISVIVALNPDRSVRSHGSSQTPPDAAMRRVPTFVKLARTQSGFKGAGKEISHPRYVWKNYQNGPQEAHFEHFGGTGPDMARMGLTRLILNTLAPWAQIWPSAEHFGGLGPDITRMGLRRLILSTLAAQAQIWPEWASRGSF